MQAVSHLFPRIRHKLPLQSGQNVGDALEALVNTQTICYGWTAGSRCSKTGQMVPAVTNTTN